MRQRPNRLSDLLYKAYEKENRSDAWDMWLMRYQNMSKEDFIPFDEFYQNLTTPQITYENNETVQDTFRRFKEKVRKN